MTDIIQKVRQFTEAVGCTTDHYNVRQTALYLGLMAEEFCEALESLDWGGIHHTGGDFTTLIIRLKQASASFKSGELDMAVAGADRAELLDACLDGLWVHAGCALSQGADVEGAAGEVARANLSKLVECECEAHPACSRCNGLGIVAIKDENGKVKKPPTFSPPNIEPFVCKEGATA